MASKNHFVGFASVVLATLATSVATRAAVIPVSVSGGAIQDRNLIATGVGNVSGLLLNAGETGLNANNAKPYIPFTLTEADIADVRTSGSAVTLRVVALIAANPTTYTLDLVGLPGQGADPVAVAADYSSVGTTIATAITPAVQVYTFDVRSFVLSEINATPTPNSVVAFRFDLVGLTLPNTNTVTDGVTFASGDNGTIANRPTLNITVPEPASIAGLAGAAATLLVRRRRGTAR